MSTLPPATEGRALPKKSVVGAPVLVPPLTAGDVTGTEYAPPVVPAAADASINSGAAVVVRLNVSGP
jgi:hypothetical protein